LPRNRDRYRSRPLPLRSSPTSPTSPTSPRRAETKGYYYSIKWRIRLKWSAASRVIVEHHRRAKYRGDSEVATSDAHARAFIDRWIANGIVSIDRADSSPTRFADASCASARRLDCREHRIALHRFAVTRTSFDVVHGMRCAMRTHERGTHGAHYRRRA